MTIRGRVAFLRAQNKDQIIKIIRGCITMKKYLSYAAFGLAITGMGSTKPISVQDIVDAAQDQEFVRIVSHSNDFLNAVAVDVTLIKVALQNSTLSNAIHNLSYAEKYKLSLNHPNVLQALEHTSARALQSTAVIQALKKTSTLKNLLRNQRLTGALLQDDAFVEQALENQTIKTFFENLMSSSIMDLVTATKENDLNRVKAIVEKQPYLVNWTVEDTEYGTMTPILYCGNKLEILKYLESQQANIHDRSDRLLYYAAGSGSMEVAKYLIESKGFVPKEEDISVATTHKFPELAAYLSSKVTQKS